MVAPREIRHLKIQIRATIFLPLWKSVTRTFMSPWTIFALPNSKILRFKKNCKT